MGEASTGGRETRLLFSSYHCYVDPSSGAALATRDLLEMLADRGWSCEVFCGPRLDFEEGASLPRVFGDQGLSFRARSCAVGPAPFVLFLGRQGPIPVTVYCPPVLQRYRPPVTPGPEPGREEGYAFLALFERVLERSRPDFVLTYGGQWLTAELIACARRRGVRVVFALHNLAYHEAGLLRAADAVLVPSRYAQIYYQRTLGLACTVLPSPLNWARIRCPDVRGRYGTLVNPQPHKGVFVFARIALELGRKRPDIPLLVVEGRGKAGWLRHTGLDLGGLSSLYVMGNTPDPRDFYHVSRLVLMPSLGQETFGRVAAEAMINGIPVLASRRGALPEVMGQAGFLFDVPERYTPETRVAPTAEEVAPWVETIIRLWDDAELYESERHRCRTAAEVWRPEQLGSRYVEFLSGLLRRPAGSHTGP